MCKLSIEVGATPTNLLCLLSDELTQKLQQIERTSPVSYISPCHDVSCVHLKWLSHNVENSICERTHRYVPQVGSWESFNTEVSRAAYLEHLRRKEWAFLLLILLSQST